MKLFKISAIIAVLLLTTLMTGVMAAPDDGNDYLALGDSIGAGYALPEYTNDSSDPPGAYACIIAKEKGMKLTNLSVSGMNTDGLLAALETKEYADAVAQAELITLSIGSNDVLIPALTLLAEASGGSSYMDMGEAFGTELTTAVTALEVMYKTLSSQESIDVFEKGCETFEGNWDKIITTIRQLNKDADIAVTGFYNPYNMLNIKVGLVEIGITDFVDGYLNRMNDCIKNSPLSGEYVFADVAGISTNVRIFVTDTSQFNFDPHPDTAGHKSIANSLTKALSKPAEPVTQVIPEIQIMLTNQFISMNGQMVDMEVYNIDGNNYFRLRDLAYLLREGDSRFSISYDKTSRTVDITTGSDYEPDGSEMRQGVDNSATAMPSNQTIMVNGEPLTISAYNIGGGNFFKIRELGEALGFTVDYDGTARTVLLSD